MLNSGPQRRGEYQTQNHTANLRYCYFTVFHNYNAGMAMELWVEFFEDLEDIRGRSRNTVMAYRRDLELFDEYSGLTQPAVLAETISIDVQGFYLFMNKRALSPRSQARGDFEFADLF